MITAHRVSSTLPDVVYSSFKLHTWHNFSQMEAEPVSMPSLKEWGQVGRISFEKLCRSPITGQGILRHLFPQDTNRDAGQGQHGSAESSSSLPDAGGWMALLLLLSQLESHVNSTSGSLYSLAGCIIRAGESKYALIQYG